MSNFKFNIKQVFKRKQLTFATDSAEETYKNATIFTTGSVKVNPPIERVTLTGKGVVINATKDLLDNWQKEGKIERYTLNGNMYCFLFEVYVYDCNKNVFNLKETIESLDKWGCNK